MYKMQKYPNESVNNFNYSEVALVKMVINCDLFTIYFLSLKIIICFIALVHDNWFPILMLLKKEN